MPFVEYFKYITDDVYVYLMQRTIVMTDETHYIAARDGFIYYSDSAFT